MQNQQEKFNKDFQELLYKFKALNFCFQIQGLSSFVRTLFSMSITTSESTSQQPNCSPVLIEQLRMV
jgi:hypothetical protein